MKRLICFQLLNDYSGSPKVLKTVLEGFCKKGVMVELFTSNTHGVLEELKCYGNFKIHTYQYVFSQNHLVTLIRFTWVQILTFFKAFRYIFSRDAIFYINTLLPIGPAIAGRIMGKRIVYHYHENADIKGSFYKLLAAGMQKFAHEIVCVSKYQSQFLKRQDIVTVVPNAIPNSLIERLHPNIDVAFERKKVLMLSSLKEYKGTIEFFRLSSFLPQYKFALVINDTQENIDLFVKDKKLEQPPNLIVYSRQSDVSRFYNESSVVLNLTNREKFIETFGLTILEAMSAALPVIVPTVGGIADMVENGVNGYKIEVQKLDRIKQTIDNILSDELLYKKLATNALTYSKEFSETKMITKIYQIIWK